MNKTIVRCSAVAALLFSTLTAQAQLQVVPNVYANSIASTSGSNTFISDSGNPRSGHLLIHANQLTSLIGRRIGGVSFRLWTNATSAFPATGATWTDFTISVGPGVAFGSQTTTFASNFASPPTVVRSGPLTVNAGSYAFTVPSPKPFGAQITFDTPYLYTGGNLLIEIHTGSNIVNNAANDFLEVALTSDPGFNVNFWSATANDNTATTGTVANFTIARLHALPAQVVPNAFENTPASAAGLNTFIRDAGNPRSGQLLIHANQLAGQIGRRIAGISFRLFPNATTAFPATDATWIDFTISVGPGVAFGSQTTTFASNFASSPTVVRSGPLVVPAGSYVATPTNPKPFGSQITFDTPYLYTGGNLLIEIRHTGSNIVNNAANDFLDSVLTSDPGFNVNFWSATANGNTATTGTVGNFTVTRLHSIPIPTAVVSRKIHGAVTFDLPLALTGTPVVEPRSGAGGTHQLVFTFPDQVTYSSATIISGTGSVAGTSGRGTTTPVVNLTGVANAQRVTVRLANVVMGGATGDVNVSMGVLLGDVIGNGLVNATDIAFVKSQAGMPVTGANFRADVVVNGSINATDIGQVKAVSGTGLPPAPPPQQEERH